MRRAFILLVFIVLSSPQARGDEPVDLDMVNQIRDEGFHRSQVMDTMRVLTDEIGPRLTGSPGMDEANEWTRERLESWGLENAHLDGFRFGHGWSFDRTAVHMISPRPTPLMALPKAWTPGTDGPVRGRAVRLKIENVEDLEEIEIDLDGAIVFVAEPPEVPTEETVAYRRYDDHQLDELEIFEIHGAHEIAKYLKRRQKRVELLRRQNELFEAEGVVAVVDVSSRPGGTIRLGGAGSRLPGESVGVPTVAMAVEQYNWITRLLEEGHEVELELDIEARFHDQTEAFNTIAEIPGTDLADEVVMLGAHLDSWHAATGSNDNAAGVAVVMEAVRILKTLGVEPRRTVRIALWSGEEQGLFGSQHYVNDHLATRPEPTDEESWQTPYTWAEQWPLEIQPEHELVSAYFNLDNGSGKIRGIYTEENVAVVPIFERWLEPFADLGAETVATKSTGGTDHRSFDAVGVPGFQFVQDGLDYRSLTHHTNLDTLDHAREDDLKQASVIMASFVYHAAMRDERLPREPMPQAPEDEE